MQLSWTSTSGSTGSARKSGLDYQFGREEASSVPRAPSRIKPNEYRRNRYGTAADGLRAYLRAYRVLESPS